jgi:nucleoside-diphosphate-sugar epimerase
MNILITGWNGYLMSHLKRKERPSSIHFWGIVRSEKFLLQGNIIYCDLLNKQHIEQLKNISIDFHVVLHAASKIEIHLTKNLNNNSPTCGADTFTHVYEENVLSTSNILELMRFKNIPKLIFLSSQSVYGMPDQTRITEESQLNPLEHYALSKVICEKIIELCSFYMEIEANILRLGGVYGESRRTGLIYNLLSSSMKKISLDININYHLPLDFVHIDDVCTVLLKILTLSSSQTKLQFFNCTSGENTNVGLIIDDVHCITGVRHNFLIQDSPILNFKNNKLLSFLNISFKPRKDHLRDEWQKINAIA